MSALELKFNRNEHVFQNGEKVNKSSVCNKGNKSSSECYEVKQFGKMSIKEMVELFEIVSGSGLPNYQGCRVQLPASKNLWRKRLVSYEDKIVCEFLEFGFPLDFDRTRKLNYEERRNHKGARDFPEFIGKKVP